MSHKFSKLLALVIVLISSINSYAQSQDYPKVLDNFIYPLGYDKNIFDTPFSDFEKYALENYSCSDDSGGFRAKISKEIFGIRFLAFHCSDYKYSSRVCMTYAAHGYSKAQYDKFISDFEKIGCSIISSETEPGKNGLTKSQLRFKNILSISISYLPEYNRIEVFCKKVSPDLATGFPKVKPASIASASSTKSNSNNLQDILIGEWIILTKTEYDEYKQSGEFECSKGQFICDNNGKCMYCFYDKVDDSMLVTSLKWVIAGNSKLLLYYKDERLWGELKITNFTNKEIHYSQTITVEAIRDCGLLSVYNGDFVLIKIE